MSAIKLLELEQAVLLVIDVQEKLLPVLPTGQRFVAQLQRLIRGVQILNVPVLVTEQYPRGLGSTIHEIKQLLTDRSVAIAEKLTFSCVGSPEFMQQLQQTGKRQVIVAGIESHVCVMQTVLELLKADYQVFVPADAITGRLQLDHQIAVERMRFAGAQIVTIEMVLFELCRVAGTSQFKQLSALIREPLPS
jgi:nicotinamidase-related amidase